MLALLQQSAREEYGNARRALERTAGQYMCGVAGCILRLNHPGACVIPMLEDEQGRTRRRRSSVPSEAASQRQMD
eukprot:5709997-Prymnesium_polylepis.1